MLIDLVRIEGLAVHGAQVALVSPAGPARFAREAGGGAGWEDLRGAAGAGPWRVVATPGAAWVVGAGRAVRAAAGAAAAAVDLGAAAAAGAVAVADDGARWAIAVGVDVRVGIAGAAAAASAPVAPLPQACRELAFLGRSLVAAGDAGLFSLDVGDPAAAWRTLSSDPPIYTLVPDGGKLHYVGRTGAHALEADLTPARDARDFFRLDGGRLWGGPGGIVGLRDRLFALSGTPNLRNWAPLSEPALTVRSYAAGQVRSVLPARAGVYLGTAGSGLLFLPAGDTRWERVVLPGLSGVHAAEAVLVAAEAAGAGAAEAAVWVAAGGALWRVADVEGIAPAPEPVARALLVFPRGPDPALADSMVYPDGSGAHACGAVLWKDALWYAAGAVPGEQAGVLRRATAAEDASLVASPPGPAAQDLVLDTEERPWAVLATRLVHLAALAGEGVAGAPDAIAVGAVPNVDEFAAAHAPEAELPGRLGRFRARPITAVAFARDAAIVAVAGGADTRAPISQMHQTHFRARVVHVGLDGRPESVVSITEDGTDRAAVGVRAMSVRGSELWLAAAFGLAAFRRVPPGDPPAPPRYELHALGTPGVQRPPYVRLLLVNAGVDRLVIDPFAWVRVTESSWHRWTAEAYERYQGIGPVTMEHEPWKTPAAEALFGPGEHVPGPEPRPYNPNRDRGWTRVEPPPPGLPTESAAVTAAADTDGALWLGTTAGLVRFDRATETYRTLGARDGLTTQRITSLRPQAGWLLVSTIDGVFLLPA